MKELYNVLTNSSNLRLLIGTDLDFSFPLKYPGSKDPKKLRIKTTATLLDIIKATEHKRVRSHDPELDQKHPIELAVSRLYKNGLTREVIYKILKNKASVNSKQIKGNNSYLANFISDKHRLDVLAKLKEVRIDNYGRFTRNGQLF